MGKPEVIIIGAGVLGLSVAHHLASHRIPVLLVERETSYGRHASSKNAGMFRQLYRHPQLTEWASRSRELWPDGLRLKAFKQTGSLIAGRQVPNHHQDLFHQTSIDIPSVNGKETVPAVYTPTDGLMNAVRYCDTIYEITDGRYVTCKFHSEVTDLTRQNDLWRIRLSDNSTYEAPWVVNAAGAWVNRFLKHPLSPDPIPVRSFARHLFLVQGWQSDYLPQDNIGFLWNEESEWYMRRWEKTVSMLSLCDRIAMDPDRFSPDETIIKRVREFCSHNFLQESDLAVARSWHCFRTYAEDQLPVWGEDDRSPKLFWLAAFGGFGMSTSFAATYDAAQYILGHGQRLETRDFLPSRLFQEAATSVANL